jgi:hypothetical protein
MTQVNPTILSILTSFQEMGMANRKSMTQVNPTILRAWSFQSQTNSQSPKMKNVFTINFTNFFHKYTL